MREGLRIGAAVIGAALVVSPAQLHAQASQPESNAAASNRVGPSELEGFSLNGTVTRPAEPQPEPAEPTRREAPTERPATSPTAPPVQRPETVRPVQTEPVPVPRQRVEPEPPPAPSEFTPAPEQPAAPGPAFSGAGDDAASPFSAAGDDAAPLSTVEGPSMLPWLLALLFAATAGAFLLLRQRSQRQLTAAGGASLDFAAPEPASPRARTPSPPAPNPPAAPPAPRPTAAPPAPFGIVSTRLRPWIELEFTPTRCIVEEERAIIQFDVAMFNSGGAPARDLLLEMGIFNAGPSQDEEIAVFQAKPPGAGPRVPVIEPLRRVERSSQIAVGLDKLRVFEANGRRFFVPMLVLNAYYGWSGGEGRTSASFLVGRDGTDSDKMAPFRLDLGPRVFRGLGAREHHLRVRM